MLNPFSVLLLILAAIEFLMWIVPGWGSDLNRWIGAGLVALALCDYRLSRIEDRLRNMHTAMTSQLAAIYVRLKDSCIFQQNQKEDYADRS